MTTREQENRPDIAEQNQAASPEGSKAKFGAMVAAAKEKAMANRGARPIERKRDTDFLQEEGITETGGLHRELELQRGLGEAEAKSADPEHFHKEGWAQQAEKIRTQLAQNESVMEARIDNLPPEEAARFRGEIQDVLARISTQEQALGSNTDLKTKQQHGEIRDRYLNKLIEMEKQLPHLEDKK